MIVGQIYRAVTGLALLKNPSRWDASWGIKVEMPGVEPGSEWPHKIRPLHVYLAYLVSPASAASQRGQTQAKADQVSPHEVQPEDRVATSI